MVRRLFFLACFAVFINKGIAQQQELDSLLSLLSNYSKEDTTRLQLLNDIAYNYSRIDPAKGLLVADEAIKLAGKLKDAKKLAAANSYKGMNYGGLGDDSLALEYYQRALAIHSQVSDRLRMATTYNNIAITLVNLSDYPKAMEYHEKAFTIFQQLGDKMRMGNSLNNRGVIYLYLSDYSQALKYYLQALSIFEQQENKQLTANSLMNVGLVYDHLSDFDKALVNHHKALDLYEAGGNKQGVINALGNIGNVYHNMNKSEEALQYYQRALDSSQAIGDKRGIASNFSNMGIVYNSIGEFEKAFEYLQKSLAINQQSGDKKRISGDLNEIGKVYLNASAPFLKKNGISSSQRFSKVVEYENRSLDMAREIGHLDMQREAWNVLSQAYEKQGDHKNSLQAYRQYIVMRDSIINARIKQDVTRKEMQFEYEKKEVLSKAEQERLQAAALAATNRQRLIKNGVIGMGLVLLIAGLSSFVFYKRKRDVEAQKKEAEFRLKSAETEMQVLRLQMNPHFIFNSLNSINHYIDKHDTDKATLYTTKFAKLMRMILENSRQEEISLADDLAALELYMQLEALRLQGSFTYEIKIEEEIDAASTMVPPMLLQPFVENSIWHGLSKKTGPGKILIHVKKKDGMIKYIVEDDGVGRQLSSPESATEISTQKKSLGIKITKDRIDIINRIKKSDAALSLSDLDKGFRVEVTLPYETWS
ncbi:MAG: tetratricopeptide repeat protein [Chitinophagaceae bacterium]